MIDYLNTCLVCSLCTYICVYIYLYACMYVYMYVWMYVCMYVRMNVCMYVRMYVWVYVCMHDACMYVSFFHDSAASTPQSRPVGRIRGLLFWNMLARWGPHSEESALKYRRSSRERRARTAFLLSPTHTHTHLHVGLSSAQLRKGKYQS